MSATAAIGLDTSLGGAAILEAVGLEATLNDLFAEVMVEQRYRNPEPDPIEAVYTFPLPTGAALLGFSAEVGEKKLEGTVAGKALSENQYEDAIAAGDAAVLLETAGEGLYTASVGNLLPGERATIRFRYGLLLAWNGDRVRFAIPTAIAPRYGDPGAAGLAGQNLPVYGFDSGRNFSLRIRVTGLLGGARFNSPSHVLSVVPEAGETLIGVSGNPAMDRDFVLEARADSPGKACALVARDGEGWVTLASFCPTIPAGDPGERRGVTIVVDCSGSMQGESIAAARSALERILDGLRKDDLFEIIAFGNDQKALFSHLQPVSEPSLARARGFVRGLDADLGGTEIALALEAAWRVRGPSGISRDVFLITDGQVWDAGELTLRAKGSGQRIFAVGVGEAAVEACVRGLAEATGGAAEFVSPREDMASRIERHFRRIAAPSAERIVPAFPVPLTRVVPDPIRTVFDGDTLHLFAWSAEQPEGTVMLEITLPDGRVLREEAGIRAFAEGAIEASPSADAGVPTLARLAQARRLTELADATEGKNIALRYQLLSRWTNYLVVHARKESEKSEDLPRIRRIPQIALHESVSLYESAALSAPPGRAAPLFRRALGSLSRVPEPPTYPAPLFLVAGLNARRMPPAPTLDDLTSFADIPEDVLAGLRALVAGGEAEGSVVVVFLQLVTQAPMGRDLSRQARRLIRYAFRMRRPPGSLIDAVEAACKDWLHPGKPAPGLLSRLARRA